MSRIALIIVYGMLALGHLRCSMQVADATGGSETTNGITACANRTDGTPAAGATVRLRRSDYVAPLPSLAKTAIYGADAVTDSSGRFEITGIDPGSYRIEVRDAQSSVLFACSLDVRDTVNLGADTLRPFATITGTIDTAGRAGQQLYVQVEGLERIAAVGMAGRFALSDLPAGTFAVRAATTNDTTVAVSSGISVGPGAQTTVTVPSGWRFSKRLYINTTVTGANVAENVTNFPLLIRLDSSTLASASTFFSQSADSGQDVRFVKSDATPLPYEIEQWDQAARTAAIWVKMDTVYGNSSGQFFSMMWGSSASSAPVSMSSGAPVFDTADGFGGVWHLGDSPVSGSYSVMDATGYGGDGQPQGQVSAAQGAIGAALSFGGTDGMVLAPHTHGMDFGTGDITFSAWVKTKQTSQGILTSTWNPRVITLMIGNQGGAQCGIRDIATGWNERENSARVNDNAWHHVAAVFSRNGFAKTYTDGVAGDSVDIRSKAGTDFDSSWVRIGYNDFDTSSHFIGAIDEARVERTSRSSSWLRLSAESQKPGSRCVRSDP